MKNKDQELAISWALIVALKTAQSAAFTLHSDHLKGRNKQRVGNLYRFINTWMKQTTLENRKAFAEFDDMIEDNATAAFETFMLIAGIPNQNIDAFMDGVNKLYNDLKVSNATTTKA